MMTGQVLHPAALGFEKRILLFWLLQSSLCSRERQQMTTEVMSWKLQMIAL